MIHVDQCSGSLRRELISTLLTRGADTRASTTEKGMINSFSRDYSEARDKFLSAAKEAGARVMHHRLNRE